MKVRLIATVLMLACILGSFGCAWVPPSETENADATPENFLSASAGGLLGAETQEADLLNLAATDESGAPLYQIVYNINSSLRVQEQCEALAADIYEATGVMIPIVHSSERQKTYEILVGDVKRVETLETVDGFDLEDSDFAICAVDTRLLLYAKTDYAVVSAMLYFKEALVSRSSLQKLYGIEKDLSFIYHPAESPEVSVSASEDGKYLHVKLQDGPAMVTYLRLSYTGNGAWRMQTKYREEQEFKDTGAAQLLAYSLGEHKLGTEDERFYTEAFSAVSQTGSTYVATAPDGSRVEVSTPFRLNIYTPEGMLANSITHVSCNAGGTRVTGELNEGEAVFGTGERMNGANQRGKEIEMFSKDIWSKENACYMVIPLLSFSRGSGVFINNYEHMVLDLDTKKQNLWSALVTGAAADCYFFAVDRIEDVIHNYSGLSGYAAMPEEWTYGMLVCAYSPEFSQKWTVDVEEREGRGNEGVYDMIANMETYDLPWTGVLAEGWGPYNARKNEDLKELCDYVHSLGKKFLVYIRVGNATSKMLGYRSEYLVTQTQADGTQSYNLPDTTADTNNPDVGTATRTHVYLDITNPSAVEWFFDEFWGNLTKNIGVDGVKIDFCETFPENYELNYFDENIPTAGSHHWYPTAFCAMFYDMLAQKPDSGMCYTRGGGIGSQRAPFMWAGDQERSWAGIGYQLSAILTSGLSGVPYMSYDMAGYQHKNKAELKNIANEYKVFLRGTAYSAFTICIQTHGNVRRSYQFAEYAEPVLDKDGKEIKDENGNTVVTHPYVFVTEIYRAYTKLHEHLTPYITELSEDASTTGMPLVRHLVLGWQEDANVYGISDEFMLGDAFLVAPLLADATSRSVYLPEGKWEDLNTGEIHDVGAEGKTVPVEANIAELPTFFNMNTESETARELVDGIKDLYDYARTFAP